MISGSSDISPCSLHSWFCASESWQLHLKCSSQLWLGPESLTCGLWRFQWSGLRMGPGTSDSTTEPDGLQAGEPLFGKHVTGGRGGVSTAFLSWLADLGSQGLSPSLTALANRPITDRSFSTSRTPFLEFPSPWTPAMRKDIAGSDKSLTVLLKDMKASSGLSQHYCHGFPEMKTYRAARAPVLRFCWSHPLSKNSWPDRNQSFLSPAGHLKCFHVLWSHLYHVQ